MAAKPTRRNNLPRPTETGVTITIGLMNTICSLHPIQDSSGKRAIKLVTLDPGLHRVGQYYVCEETVVTKAANGDTILSGGCTPPAGQPGFKTGDMKNKGREQGKGQPVIALTADEVAATKNSDMPAGVLELSLCPASEVDSATWPYGTAYWVEPDRADTFYLALCRKLAEGDLAAVGTINLRDTEKFVRLMPHNGGFVMQEVLRPGDTWKFEAVEGEIPAKLIGQMNALFEMATEPFDADAFQNDRVSALQALIAAKATGEVIATITPMVAVQAATDDIEAQLAASLAILMAAKAKKAS